MARTITGFASIATLAACACLIVGGCSDDEGENTIETPGGGGTGNSPGTGGNANSPGTGGNANSPGTGGTANSPGTGGTANSPGTGGSGNTSSGGSSATGSGGIYSGEPCPGLPFVDQGGEGGANCVGVAEAAEAIPVDMYIMMDQSVSMNETIQGQAATAGEQTRWDGVADAVQQFVQSPEAANLGVGIQFFGVNGVLTDLTANCDVDHYATPVVPIGDLADVGQDIVDAISATGPSTYTPTYPAVQGALQYAADFAATSDRGRLTLVVLVTDGLPTQCAEQRISEIAALAEQALNQSGVLTFVVGLAEGMWNLNQIAQAGGTGTAYIIQEGDVAAQFLDAMLNITATPLACSFDIPEAPTSIEVVDFDEVQMVYTPSGGEPEEIQRVNSSADCNNPTNQHGGWYYNNPNNPTVIRVCPCTCDRFGAGMIEIRFGCEPRTFSLG